jgi:hypothetical protein
MTKKYYIDIHYVTGDSFNTHDTSEELAIRWDNKDLAIEALERIKLRDKWGMEKSRIWGGGKEMEKHMEALTKLPGYDPQWGGESGLTFKLDDGTEQFHVAFWEGYFERFKWAEILSTDESMRYAREYE